MSVTNCIGRTILALALCAHCQLDAVATPLPEPVRDELRRANIPLSGVGILVQEVGTETPLLNHNAERAMNPASTMKLLTTVAALDILGPAYRWKTELFLDGKLENGVLDGNAIFKGYGDPKLTMEQFWLWLRELRQLGLRDIHGDIVLDRDYFDLPRYDPGRFDRDPTRAYNVGPDALLLNFNALRLRLMPGSSRVDVLLDPDLSGYTLVNKLKPVTARRCASGSRYRVQLRRHDIVIGGTIPANCGTVDKYLSLLPHDAYFFAVFSALWKELGGTISGTFRDGRAPENVPPFSTHPSIPLSEAIRDINKFSNNLMARQLFLTLGAPVESSITHGGDDEETDPTEDSAQDSEIVTPTDAEVDDPDNGGNATLTESERDANAVPARGTPAGTPPLRDDPAAAPARSTPVGTPPLRDDPAAAPASSVQESTNLQAAAGRTAQRHQVGTAAKSKAVIKDWLKSHGLDFPELVMENGAGLSRVARISPMHLADVLQHAAAGRYASELEASLPILGTDGTLRKRLNDERLAGYAHLKTGLLSGVKSIAGYVRSNSGKRWIVVMLINDRHASSGQSAQDALIRWVQEDN